MQFLRARMKIKIENITISLLREGEDVRVKSSAGNVILPNQNREAVAELIKHNFYIVINHYKCMIEKQQKEFDNNDIHFVSISIVLYYLYTYNSWRTMYKREQNKDLRFYEKDFSNPSTHDILFLYFKKRYSKDWEDKCAVLVGMKLDELKKYYKTREDFYNK